MLKGFRDFILRGNVVDLAVAVIIGAAFSAITTSMTTNVITPLISALVGAPNFDSFAVHVPVLHHVAPCVPEAGKTCPIPPGEIQIGKFLNAAISFLIQAAVIYFLIVLPMQKLLARINGPAAVTTKSCPECLSEIPLAATRCKFCTTTLPRVA